MNKKKLLIVEDAVEVRIDRYLRRVYPRLPQSQIEKLLRKKKILLNGCKSISSSRVSDGDKITILVDLASISTEQKPLQREEALTNEQHQEIASWILWEDEHLLILNKPAGLACQGGSRVKSHLDNLLQRYDSSKKFRLTHRLDKDTSGVLVVAKTAIMAAHVTKCFRDKSITKAYWAVVNGQPSPGEGRIEAALSKGTGRPKERVFIDKDGSKAITEFRTLKRLGREKAWLELYPLTGRTHQLRAHMEYINCPIAGDPKYGSPDNEPSLQLHARKISFRDLDNILLTFTAPPPQHMEKILHKFAVHYDQYA